MTTESKGIFAATKVWAKNNKDKLEFIAVLALLVGTRALVYRSGYKRGWEDGANYGEGYTDGLADGKSPK